jgi:hypothetical protein
VQRTILIKYLNGIAPVGKVVNKYDPKYPTSCPSCQEAQETQDHMLRSPCINRQVWRESLFKAILDVLEEYQTPKEVTQLMFEGIHYSIGQQDTMSQNFPPIVAAIASTQIAIGWNQVIKGRLVNKWKQGSTGIDARERNKI